MYTSLGGPHDEFSYMNASGGMNMTPPRYTGLPSTTQTLVEQVESGGTKIEETLQQMNCSYQTLFFIGGLLVIIGGTIGLLGSIFSFEISNIINSTFLQIFGVIMTVLDVPGNPQWVTRYRSIIRKYVRFLTRITGKSLWFLFLGCLVTTTLWPSNKGSGGALLFAVMLSMPIVAISLIGMMIALKKSLRLDKVRKSILAKKTNLSDTYSRYSLIDTQHGMQMEEFNRLSADQTGGKIQFHLNDLGIIYNALDDHQKCAINEKEFFSWMTGSMTLI